MYSRGKLLPVRIPKTSSPSSCQEHFDLALPIPEETLPRYHDLPVAWVHARNEQVMSETHYDEKYFAESLARKFSEPFVMH
jgi:hypothetical protein